MRGLKNKVAIVTGGASGIGAATARRLTEEGALVAVADINVNGAREVANEIGSETAFAYDARDEASIADLVAAVVAHFGRLDILHNNAGALSPGDTNVLDTSLETWDAAMALNSRAYFAGAKHAIPHMILSGGGVIINTASSSALAGQMAQTAYGSSKAGIIALTQYIATQYGRQNIRANSISPGIIMTPPIRKMAPELGATMGPTLLTDYLGAPEDVAATVAFLASEDARYITGQNLCVDGGLFAHAPYVTF
ncbi:NAD(P)-dependent dehydrogenase (short-subunit alcohol dehydrogenase family) [Arthrobacter sp. SLBN-100]|uniref:SDR family NAD(P)-dependent oxidoreductase n=1 Tax=Arthrobacter sp. SLBN-100 TaxID=2768450 RepID=UPI0011519697|nr:SDR family oxidoreductase [Arthrobacter sp. SLBN-100]TQJ62143.1 NAD(P)-dependent dehydrogenase (short-subunit alcohol dehydrogenase family) [Arthrobacter sp. SLBN-100]